MQKHFIRCAWVTAAFAVTLAVSMYMLPGSTDDTTAIHFASLVFLPHGVRVIAAWLYGWMSVIYLAPVAMASHWFRMGGSSFQWDWSAALMPMFGIICVPAVFDIAARLGADLRLQSGKIANWKDVVLVGCFASVISAVGANLFAGNDLATTSLYLIGDIVGMLVLLLGLMIIFRIMRHLGF